MSEINPLLNELNALAEQGDLDGLRRVREQVVLEHSESEAYAEAAYKLGLDRLFRDRDMAGATEAFQLAIDNKHEVWSKAARTSLGICMYHRGQPQKAFFELRRVGYTETPCDHSLAALAFLEVMHQQDGDNDSADRVRSERIRQLTALVSRDKSMPSQQLGANLFALAGALREQNETEAATAALTQAHSLGSEMLGSELYEAVVQSMG